MTPEPVTPQEQDFHVRAHTCYDLEVTLVAFIQRILSSQRLDNPTLNLGQPDVVPFDYKERAQTLTLKVTPRVLRGYFPRTVTGDIAIDKLPEFPAVIVQAVSAHIEKDVTTVVARIFVCAYDENPDGGGYQDALNLTETIAQALTSYGQQAIDKAYPIILPIEWKTLEADTFPHYVVEMTTQWELPSGRPMPDMESGIVPGEHLEFKIHFETHPDYVQQPPRPYEPPPPEPEVETALVASYPVENMTDPDGKSIQHPDTGYSQSFICEGNGVLHSARFWLFKSSLNVATDLLLAAKLYSGRPDVGAEIATSDPINASDLSETSSPQDFVFTGANQIDLIHGQEYSIAVEQVGGTLGTDAIRLGLHAGIPGYDGDWFILNPDMGGWITQGTLNDIIFEVYATGVEVPAPIPPDPTLEDCWPVENMNDGGSYGMYGTNIHCSWSFTAKRGGVLDRVKVWMKGPAVAADPPTDITASIYDTSMPIGSALPEGVALAVSDPIDGSAFASGTVAPIEFFFTGANKLQLVKDKVYCLVFDRLVWVEQPNPSYDSWRFGFHASGLSPNNRAPGNFAYGPDGLWTYSAPYFDMINYIYSDP